MRLSEVSTLIDPTENQTQKQHSQRMDQENETRASQTAIKLLTLLNVAAARPSPLKRKADLLFERRDWNQIARKAVRLGGNRDGKGKEGVSRVEAVGGRVGEEVVPVEGEIGATDEEEDVVDDDGEGRLYQRLG